MEYTFQKTNLMLDKLDAELKAITSKVQYLSWDAPSTLRVITSANLSTLEQNAVSAAVVAHQSQTVKDLIKAAIINGMSFGCNLIADYGTTRKLRGCGIEDTERVLQKLGHIQTSLMSGSLYVALAQLERLEADEDIPQEDIDEFKAKLQAYLGV